MVKRYLSFNVGTRAELVLARKYAEFHGFQPRRTSAELIDGYSGGPCRLVVYFNPLLKENAFRLVYKRSHLYTDPDYIVVNTLDEFKYALDTFYHDGYLDEDNFKV